MLIELEERQCYWYTFSSPMSFQLAENELSPNTIVNMVLEVGSYIAFYVL